jgi:hypothetical protein
VLTLIILGSIWKSFNEFSKKDICTKSLIMSQIKLKGIVDELGNPVQIMCSTDYYNVKSNNDDVIKKEIADRMAQCWDTYLRGEREIFNTRDNNFCVICSRLNFSKDTELKDFSGFLAANRVPGQKKTYMDFMRKVFVVNYEKEIESDGKITKVNLMPTKDPLAIVFVMEKNAFPNAVFEMSEEKGFAIGSGVLLVGGAIVGIALCPETAGIGCAVTAAIVTGSAGGVAGGAIGYRLGAERSADWDSEILLYPYNKLADLNCTYLESKSTPLKVKEI